MLVNPYVEELSEAIRTALEMSLPERQARHAALNECVRRNNTFQWCNSFLASLKQAHERQQVPPGWRQLETGWRSTEKVRAAFHRLQRSVGDGAASGEPAQERSARAAPQRLCAKGPDRAPSSSVQGAAGLDVLGPASGSGARRGREPREGGKLVKPAMRGKKAGFAVGPAGAGAPFTLAVDIGGTRIKASVLDRSGKMVAPRVEVNTPAAPKPAAVLAALEHLAHLLPDANRISIGFPGVVRGHTVITAPNLGTSDWADFPSSRRFASASAGPHACSTMPPCRGSASSKGRGSSAC